MQRNLDSNITYNTPLEEFYWFLGHSAYFFGISVSKGINKLKEGTQRKRWLVVVWLSFRWNIASSFCYPM